jgi:O-methyltransferase domain
MSSTHDNPSLTAPVEAPPAARLIQIVLGYQVTQVVGAVARLGLADRLAATTVGLIAEDEPDRFVLTPLGAYLATEAQPASLRDIAIAMTTPGHWLPCGCLFDTVMSGRPSTRAALGKELWDYYQEHPEEDALFARSMGNMSIITAAEVVASYDVTQFSRIVDIGGSQGVLLAGLLEAAPKATGLLFDRPEVIATAHPVITARGLADRVDLVGGDFLTEVPPDGDLYVLKSVLQNWDDAHALQILVNCHRAARPGSALLVIEGVVPTAPESSSMHLLNLLMLVQGGDASVPASSTKPC